MAGSPCLGEDAARLERPFGVAMPQTFLLLSSAFLLLGSAVLIQA
jgi:hypothetical protein